MGDNNLLNITVAALRCDLGAICSWKIRLLRKTVMAQYPFIVLKANWSNGRLQKVKNACFFPRGGGEGKESVRLCVWFSLQWSAFNRLRSQTVIVYSTGIPLTSKAAGNLPYEALFINPESNCVVCEPALEARLLSYWITVMCLSDIMKWVFCPC